MMVDIRGCLCSNCGKERPWRIIPHLEREEDGQKKVIRGPFIEVVPCACPRTDAKALDMNGSFFNEGSR